MHTRTFQIMSTKSFTPTSKHSELHILFERRVADQAAEVISHSRRLSGPGHMDADMVETWGQHRENVISYECETDFESTNTTFVSNRCNPFI